MPNTGAMAQVPDSLYAVLRLDGCVTPTTSPAIFNLIDVGTTASTGTQPTIAITVMSRVRLPSLGAGSRPVLTVDNRLLGGGTAQDEAAEVSPPPPRSKSISGT